jgi:hypothetical protein
MNTSYLQRWVIITNEPGLGEVLPYAEGEVADVKWFGVYLVRDVARYLAARLRGAWNPFVGWNIVW